jgi:hypothetical protein
MKRKLLYLFLIILSVLLLVIAFCKEAVVPAVTTNKYVHDITDATAEGGGTITGDGGAEVTERGFCWSPTILDSATIVTSLTTNYSCILTGLTASTLYYVRAFVLNQVDTAYGDQVSFTTLPNVTDIEAKDSSIVNIGTQVWMTDNLATT